jgi:hypothetical protein
MRSASAICSLIPSSVAGIALYPVSASCALTITRLRYVILTESATCDGGLIRSNLASPHLRLAIEVEVSAHLIEDGGDDMLRKASPS